MHQCHVRPCEHLGDDFQGMIANVRIWNVVRTATDIATSMAIRLQGNESGLVGYWTLDDG